MRDEDVLIDYTNHRGERAWRRVDPYKIKFGATGWHPEPQWLLHAWDYEKKSTRDFALKDIHAWKPAAAQDPANAA